jgi:hypothetical protein
MRRQAASHLQRAQALLELARSKGETATVRWRSQDLGSWKSADPQWLILGGRIRLQFSGQGSRRSYWVSAAASKPWGLRLLLTGSESRLPSALDVVWEASIPEPGDDLTGLWGMIRCWLRAKFPGHQLIRVSRKSDLARTISGQFLRVHFRFHGKDCLLVAARENANEEAHRIVSQALLWLIWLDARKKLKAFPVLYLLVPSASSAVIGHRCRHLYRNRVRAEVWRHDIDTLGNTKINRAAEPFVFKENKDFRWPVLGPFRWSPCLKQVLDLAPDLIRRYPRFRDYDSLRLWGLEFAQVMGPDRDRICFGVGAAREELTENNFERLRSLVQEILFYRRADGPEPRHPFYRLQAERWLEALILEDMPRLFPEMAPESVYSQIPVYLGGNPGRIDILGADRGGTLTVMELKTAADPDLPLQALDYWGRVIRHNENGDFERRGYFSEVRLNRQRPKLYLVSPVFSYHDSTESLLRYLDPDLDVWKISINEDWRCGVRVLKKVRYRCKGIKQ